MITKLFETPTMRIPLTGVTMAANGVSSLDALPVPTWERLIPFGK